MKVEAFNDFRSVAMNVYADERNRLSPEMAAKLLEVATATVAPEASAYFVELVFANQADFLPATLEKVADVADFVAEHGFYGFGENQRGAKIAKSLRGKPVTNAPEPLAMFAPAPVQPVVELLT